eukprot:COSAG01_NODE_2793_length_7060_cov_5.562563_2_plen_78_part_00
MLAAGVFACLAIMLGLREILKHWLNYSVPRLQKHVVRVLAIIPIYTIDAFVTLVGVAEAWGKPPRPQITTPGAPACQ